MALNDRITALAQAIGEDVQVILANQGSLTALNTTAKGSLVAAINEVLGVAQAAAGGGVSINDAATDGNTTETWSADKIFDELAALRSGLLNGVDPAFDTLQELATELGDQDSAINNLLTAVGNRVRFDAAQTLTTEQATQARTNIGAAAAADVGPDTDFAAAYNTAKA